MDKLSKIMNFNTEFRPSENNDKWKVVKNNNDEYKVMRRMLKYQIDDDLVRLMHDYTKVYKSVYFDNPKRNKIIKKYSDDIALIYIMDNKKTGDAYVGYTTSPLITFIKMNIHKKNIGESSIFDHFPKLKNLTDITFELLEYVLFISRSDIYDRKKYWQRKLLDDFEDLTIDDLDTEDLYEYMNMNKINEFDNLINTEDAELYNQRLELFYDVFKPLASKFTPVKGYIYKIQNAKTKRIFIGGDEFVDILKDTDDITNEHLLKKIKHKVLKNTVDTHNNKIIHDLKKYGERMFKCKIIERYNAKSPFDFMLRIDYHKLLNKAIDDGYNMDYCLSESTGLFAKSLTAKIKERLQRSMFLKMNQYLIEKNLKDDTNYTDVVGFVYEIKNIKNTKRYISYVHNTTLKDKILSFYDAAIAGNVKRSKILKIFAEEPYFKFKYSILLIKRNNDVAIDLKNEADKLIQKYNTVEDGYNIDTRQIIRAVYMQNKFK